jgi:ribose/xylose/arabinose/galactoside ABC-type transport system permease subunit
MGDFTISLNVSVLVCIIAIVFVAFFLNKTTVGRNAIAIGGNKDAAQRMGISLLKTYTVTYAIAGALAGIAMMQAFMKQGASIFPLTLKDSYADPIAAVIFSGIQVGTGKGVSVFSTILGVFTLTLIRSNLVMLGIPSYAQAFAIGLLLLGSVILSAYKDFNRE